MQSGVERGRSAKGLEGRYREKTKKKGDLKDCNNWRGITLLSVPGKVMAGIILDRIKTAIDNTLRQQQAGFRKGRSCCEQIFILRQIVEKATALDTNLLINFIDFKKAFDCLHRPSVWNIIKSYGIPENIIKIIKSLYEGSRCAVRVDGRLGDWFEIITGVRQGCLLSPLLFIIVMDPEESCRCRQLWAGMVGRQQTGRFGLCR